MLEFAPLTIDQIGEKAPSVLATEPIDRVSSKYSFVSTIDAVELIMGSGWKPVDAKESVTRSEGKKGFQSHLIRFTMGDAITKLGEERMDLLLYNSHDGLSSFQLSMGLFRLVCSNGLVVGDPSTSFRHKHINFDQDAFVVSVQDIANSGSRIAQKVEDYKLIELSPDEKGAYAMAASELISDEPEEVNKYDLVRARRYGDRKDTLWHTYNNVQENIIRGGVRRQGKKRTRKLSSIQKDIKLNKALWTLTEKMAEIRAAA